ncbi:unnamed protein product [Symbiodinium microadriaticum]|nr:unnamed protein product [Symbiodinium microadriaticum]
MPSHARPRVFPVGQQLQRLNTLKPTGDLLPKRRLRRSNVKLWGNYKPLQTVG